VKTRLTAEHACQTEASMGSMVTKAYILMYRLGSSAVHMTLPFVVPITVSTSVSIAALLRAAAVAGTRRGAVSFHVRVTNCITAN